MSLKTKFAMLLGVTGLAMAIMLGVSLWSFRVVEREVAGALHSIESVLSGLNEIKRWSWEQAEMLGESSFPAEPAVPLAQPDPERHRRFIILDQRIREQLNVLEDLDSYYTRSGITRTRFLREGADDVRDAAQRWFEHADREALARAGDVLYQQHERIERTEKAILADAGEAVEYGSHLRGLVTTGLVGAASLVVLAGALGLLLVRRWVLGPVAALRRAAARIGAGDFEHRIGMVGADEIAQLAGEVDEMASLVKHMQEERIERERLAAVGEMVQRIVHNIRGPLGGIRSLAEVVERSPDRTGLVRDSMARVKATVDRFDAWVNDMLQATRPAQIDPRRVDTESWLRSVVESHRSAAESGGVELALDAAHLPATARIDPHHMEQAVVALITNAVQAAPEGGRVLVRAENGGVDGTWRIVVEDTGPGIEPEALGRIFRPYFTTKERGSGIGLAHARQVVERHAGRIWAENIDEPSGGGHGPSGARFVVELPMGTEVSGDE